MKIKVYDLESDNLEKILNEILNIDLKEGVDFEFLNTKEIRQEDELIQLEQETFMIFSKLL